MRIRMRQDADRAAVAAFLAQWHSSRVARLGEVLDPLEHPALLADGGGRLLGVLTYVVDAGHCEILTIHTAKQWRGVGTALIEAVEEVASRHGCRELTVVTTNDNVDALRFYQRRGYRLVAVRPGAVDDSRARLKPEIPPLGAYGIPLRDEVELRKPLPAAGGTA